ncbi:GNAT family N-acetyltransferase [Bacillus gobiensis]|uniref:GNAT family N-acetyltransferase n=1 Tax=Bacillus gobiensis TaxID=1441095 RepID=UPI003D194488
MAKRTITLQVRLEPWAEKDLDLLHRMNAPEILEHIGAPETEEQILARHKRYVKIGGTGRGRMFSIILLPELEAVGVTGYWERIREEEAVYEITWGVLPHFQGRGIATAAVEETIAIACAEQKHRKIHAFPSVNNRSSNAICRKLNFSFICEGQIEYPPGSFMRYNDWCLDLSKLKLPAIYKNSVIHI